MSPILPAVRPLILCQRLHQILAEYRDATDLTVPQRRLFELFVEAGDPESWTFAVWPNDASRKAVIALYESWAAGYEMTAAAWGALLDSDEDERVVLLHRAFAAAGDPSEWVDFQTASPELKRYLSERYTAFLAEQPTR